jgi:hypothetical protein
MKKYLLSLLAILLSATSCSASKTPPIEQHVIQKEAPAIKNESPARPPASKPGWETIASKEFQVDYPTEWFAEECGLDEIIIGYDQIGSGHCGDAGPIIEGGIKIGLTGYNDVSTAARGYSQDFTTVSQHSITIAGMPAVELKGIIKQSPLGGDDVRETIILVSHNEKVLILQNDIQNSAYNDTFYSILNTLKLTP